MLLLLMILFTVGLEVKKVELLSNVNDHASKGNKFKRGFRMLTLG